MAAGKRKRGAGFSERDKFEHKSGTLLQREAKKVKAFLARKAVQQLKQQQQQADSADAAKVQKKRAQIQKRERELAALKSLDVKRVVARAFEVTGLTGGRAAAQDADERLAVESGEDSDSGFDSEEYEDARGIDGGANTRASSGEESGDEGGDADNGGEERSSEPRQNPEDKKAAYKDAQELDAMLVERVLAHKQLAPLLDAIRQWVKKEELEEEKCVRRQEKRVLKRGRKEVLVGGRSATAPSSMFLGSLSGRGGVDGLDDDDDDAAGTRAGQMAGADDDIAEFLGEKKKKNRPGQMARRQKAIRQEEARKRKEDRERGVFRPFRRDADAGAAMGKYGPSERPKKPKKQQGKDKKGSGHKQQRPSTPAPATAAAVNANASKPEIAHPSWLAKQAQKEKERASISAFSGKKITFD